MNKKAIQIDNHFANWVQVHTTYIPTNACIWNVLKVDKRAKNKWKIYVEDGLINI